MQQADIVEPILHQRPSVTLRENKGGFLLTCGRLVEFCVKMSKQNNKKPTAKEIQELKRSSLPPAPAKPPPRSPQASPRLQRAANAPGSPKSNGTDTKENRLGVPK